MSNPVVIPDKGEAEPEKSPAVSRPSSPPPTTTAPAPPKHPHHDSFRETVESVVVAFILAFLFRTFEAEAFVIPTGSMAPTLYGQHRDITCTKCGVRYSVGASEEVRDGVIDPQDLAAAAVCPNCRYPNDVVTDQIFKGDRILVDKFPYDFGTPQRWDVVVFKYPEKAGTNYIKRLVGLPGEELKIEWGDIFVRPLGTQDPFKIARKTPEKQRILQLAVYDDRHPPRELIKAGWPERWVGETDTAWSHDADARAFRIDPDPAHADKEQWLRYRHMVPDSAAWNKAIEGQAIANPALPQLVTDFYPYNSRINLRERMPQDPLPDLMRPEDLGVQWVGDLTLTCTVEVLAAAGELTFELVEGERRYRCRVDLKTGVATLYYLNDQMSEQDQEIVSLSEADTPLAKVGEHEVSFANVDDRLCFWVDGRLAKSIEFDPGSRFAPQAPPIAPTNRDLEPVGIAAKGAQVRVSELVIERDIYYRYAGPNNDDENFGPANTDDFRRMLSDPEDWFRRYVDRRKVGRYELRDFENDQEDQFFVLGDNSPRSQDSRLWPTSPAVPRRLMIGKAFCIYWPHGVPFGIPFVNGGKPIVVKNYKQPKWDPQRGDNILVPADPEAPMFSVPFYPQFGRIKRIR